MTKPMRTYVKLDGTEYKYQRAYNDKQHTLLGHPILYMIYPLDYCLSRKQSVWRKGFHINQEHLGLCGTVREYYGSELTSFQWVFDNYFYALQLMTSLKTGCTIFFPDGTLTTHSPLGIKRRLPSYHPDYKEPVIWSTD